MKRSLLLPIFIMCLVIGGAAHAQAPQELAATLEVLESGVEVLRANTSNWLPVRLEAIVGVGDQIRTDETGRARITFFADGTDTELLPNTTYRINQFEATSDTSFNLQGEVLFGQTLQRLGRLLDARSTYTIRTPGMTLVARGTAFAIRVEQTQRSAMLVSEGLVDAENPQGLADVPTGFGVRAEADAPLSDVVAATTFAELDAALDGCPATLTTPDDVSINIRNAPNRDATLLGSIDASEITQLYGTNAGGRWYRIMLEDGFGWVLSSTAQLGACAGLRVFPNDFVEGDALPPIDIPAEATPEAP